MGSIPTIRLTRNGKGAIVNVSDVDEWTAKGWTAPKAPDAPDAPKAPKASKAEKLAERMAAGKAENPDEPTKDS
jgi:hypothetical protein